MARHCFWIGLVVLMEGVLVGLVGAAPGSPAGPAVLSGSGSWGSGVGGVGGGGGVAGESAGIAFGAAGLIQGLGYGLAIALLLGAGLVILWRGGWIGGTGLAKGSRKLQIEEPRMLGHRQYLLVAEYEGRRMLLGVCPGRIDYLCPLDWEGESMPPSPFPKVEGEEAGA